MAEDHSSEALMAGASEVHQKGKDSEGNDANREENEKAKEIEKRVSESQLATELQSSIHTTEPNLETLAAVSSSVVQHRNDDLRGSSTKLNSSGEVQSKETVGPPKKEIISRETVQASPSQTENQPLVSVCSTQLSELSPASVIRSLSSVPSPTIPKQKMSPPKVNNVHVSEVGKINRSGGKTLSAVSVASSSASDGYNWRKYGQKQVKSPTGSRCYYRCNRSDCCAKKIECCDHTGHVIEIVYKSQHSHDPPQKTNSNRESKFTSSNKPTVENSVLEQSIGVLKDFDPFLSSKVLLQEAPCSADKKRKNSPHTSNNGEVILKEEHINEPEPKRRMKKSELTDLDSLVKPGKKPKFVVHATGYVGISGDGYRWHKYGQKMVKGNPHPRNYYRCTSAGCPVRKHMETDGHDSNAAIITYKGVHDHDMPVPKPKNRHGPPNAPLVAAAASASMNNLLLKKPDSPRNKKVSTRWSVDTEGELTGEALDLGGEKAIESARTLLSIGFEIKPC